MLSLTYALDLLWRQFYEQRFRGNARVRTQFSIKELCVGMMLIAAVLATVGRKIHSSGRQAIALWQMRNAGAEFDAWTPSSNVPRSIFRLVGRDPLSNVESLDIRNDAGAAELAARIATFPELQHLSFEGNVTDVGLIAAAKAIGRLPEPAQISLRASASTDEGLHAMSSSNIDHLFINGCYDITDNGLQGFEELRTLVLIGDNRRIDRLAISDAGLAHIGRMKKLVHLEILGAPITDEGLKQLENLSLLRRFRYRNTSVTAEGITRLRRALPQCRVEEAAY